MALTTTDVAEGANEYFTQARARAAFSATAPIQLSGAGVISIPQADATHDGFLSQIDWSAFNSKQNALGFTPADVAGDTFSGNVGVANQGELQLFELASNGGNFFGLMAPANLAANRHLVFPSADPVNGQLLSALAPDGSGNIVTSWIDPAAGGGGGLTNAFAVIKNAAGVTQFSAAGADALSLDATGNVAINFDATNKRVTFSGTGDWPQATNALALGGVGAAGYSLVGHIHPVTALTGGADGQFVGHVGGVPAWANLSVSGPITLNSYQIGFSRTRMVIVDQGGKGDFTTITGAVTYVAGQTRDANNIWVIEVHPGVYTEAPFTIPTFTALVALTVQAQNGNGVESKIVANASLTAGAFISMDSGSSIIGFIVSADAAVGATADTYVISTTAPTTGIVLRGQNLVIQGSNAGTTFLHSGVGGNYQLNNVVFSLSGANEVACVRHNGNFPVMTNCVFSSVVKYGVYVSAGSGTLRMINCGFDGDTPVNSGGEVFASGAGKVRAINTNVRTIAGTNATTVLSYEDRRPTTRGKIRPSAVDQTPFTLDGMSGQTAPIGLFTLNGVETVRIDEQGRFQHSVANLFRNSGFTVGLQAPTLAANGPVFKLPAADGVAKSCVVTDGAGNLSMGRKTRRAVFGLTDAATIATDVSVADVFTVTLGGNRTLGAPTNAVDGDEREWWIKQDSTGGRTLTFDTGAGGFAFSTDLPSASVVPSAAANSISGFKAKYLSLAGKWLVTGKLGGF